MNNNEEIWKSLEQLGYPEYKVSNYGNVYSSKVKRILKGFLDRGYVMIGFRDKNKRRVNHSVHRLVAISFIPRDNNIYLTVDHIDRNILNNHVSNLRWATPREQNLNKNKYKYKYKNLKKIDQYSLNGEIIKQWASVNEAANSLKIPESSIRHNCINLTKSSKTGFLWRYVIDNCDSTYDDEVWKEVIIEGFADILASSAGRVKISDKDPTLGRNMNGYMSFCVKINGKYKRYSVHRLVATAFYGKNNGMVVNHINGIRSDNRIDNLEFITQADNVKHAFKTGLNDITKQHKKVARIDPISNEITATYDSIKEAAIINNIKYNSNITAVCKERRKICGGYRWEYISKK